MEKLLEKLLETISDLSPPANPLSLAREKRSKIFLPPVFLTFHSAFKLRLFSSGPVYNYRFFCFFFLNLWSIPESLPYFLAFVNFHFIITKR